MYLEGYRYPADKSSIGNLSTNFREQGLNYWTFVGNSRIEALTAAAGDQYSDNWDSQQMRSQIAELGLNYKEYSWQNKMPVLQFALPDAQSDEGQQYAKMKALWKKTVEEIVTKSQDAAEVEDRWASLMRELETLGLDEIEKGMNERFAQNLKRYQDAGYYTNMQ